MIKYKVFEFNPFAENTYLVWETESRGCMVIDPGCYGEPENRTIKSFLDDNNLRLIYILNTHCHLDHIFGNGYIKSVFADSLLFIPERENSLYFSGPSQAQMFGLSMDRPPDPDGYFDFEQVIRLGDSEFSVLSTPGHTSDGMSFYNREEGICFTGDTLFRESIGRTDLPGGDYEKLIDSINKKLLSLPESTVILPGHGESSTISYERSNNPFLK